MNSKKHFSYFFAIYEVIKNENGEVIDELITATFDYTSEALKYLCNKIDITHIATYIKQGSEIKLIIDGKCRYFKIYKIKEEE